MTQHRLTNQEIAHIFYQIAEHLEMQDVAFKPRAYERVGRVLEAMEEPLEEIYKQGGLKALEDIPGVGVSLAEKIEELLKTGHLKYYDQLRKKTPVDIEALTAIEGVGPKTIKTLWKKLHIRSVADLQRAATRGKLRRLPGMGTRTEEKILKGIAFQRQHGGRFLLGEALPLARTIEGRLRKLPEVQKAVVAGSILRRKETIGDADVLVVSQHSQKVMEAFVSMPEVMHVYAKGETKTMLRLRNGMDVDLRIIPPESFGAALNYFTGSKDHNVALRQIAIRKGWKLNEYGLFQRKRGGKWEMIAGRTEEELYRKLGLTFIDPEMREMTGEIELARKNRTQPRALPDLIFYNDLKGDLQVQSNWTDGADSIEALARAAKAAGFSYIAITDHTKRLAMTRGLDEQRLKQQMREIDRVNKNIDGITVLKGTECDILKDGTLDLPDVMLRQLDVVGVSVHSFFSLPKAAQTRRVIAAILNPHVAILFHPTGRLLGKRPPIELDMQEVIKAAKRTGTVLEVNAYPDRLDLHDAHIRMAVDSGVKLAINSDAHGSKHFSVLEYGIAQARRGWAKKSDVINAWPLAKMLGMLKNKNRKI